VYSNGKSGFFYGYIIVAVAFSIQVLAWGLINTFGVFFKPLIAEFGWSRAAISGANSVAFCLLSLTGILAGALSDRFGPRIVVTTCGLLFGLGYVLMSKVETIWHLYLFYGLFIGIGACPTDVVLLSTIVRWFYKRRGVMSGVAKVGTGLGIFIMPLVETKLILAYGWRLSFFILGVAALVFIAASAQLLRRDPGEKGLLAYGIEEKTSGDSNGDEEGLSPGEAVRTKQFWMICAAYHTVGWVAMTVLIHIPPHAIDLGISTIHAGGILSAIGAVSMVGRVFMGNAGDKIGNRRAMMICFVISASALSWLQFADRLWMLYLFGVVYGFAHGGLFALISPAVAEFFGTRSQGTLLGIVASTGTLGGTAGPLVAGHAFDITKSYRIGFFLLVMLALMGLALVAFLKPIAGEEVDKMNKGA